MCTAKCLLQHNCHVCVSQTNYISQDPLPAFMSAGDQTEYTYAVLNRQTSDNMQLFTITKHPVQTHLSSYQPLTYFTANCLTFWSLAFSYGLILLICLHLMLLIKLKPTRVLLIALNDLTELQLFSINLSPITSWKIAEEKLLFLIHIHTQSGP